MCVCVCVCVCVCYLLSGVYNYIGFAQNYFNIGKDIATRILLQFAFIMNIHSFFLFKWNVISLHRLIYIFFAYVMRLVKKISLYACFMHALSNSKNF